MKIVKLFFLLALVTGIMSCKKDDPADQIVGSWKASKLISTNCTVADDNQNLTFTDGCYKEPTFGINLCIDVVFKADKTYTLTTALDLFGTEVESGTFTITDTELTLCPTGGSCETNTYSITDTTLNFKEKDSDTGCTNDFTMIKK
jgi:hypothetical protein